MNLCKKVALIGLDGSGKSANKKRMKKDSDYSKYEFAWVRWKPLLLKPAYFIMNKKIRNKKTNNNADDLNKNYQQKKNIKRKLFKNHLIRKSWILLVLVDYLLQFYVKNFKALLMRKNIVFNRFYIDLFIDQGINFNYSTKEIIKLIKKYRFLFPKIDKYIYIKVSPEVCFSRKDDIPNMEYLTKRYEIYEELSKENNWYVVNGKEELDVVYNKINEIILNN